MKYSFNCQLLKTIYYLPDEILEIIKEYIPKIYLIYTNKSNFILYHFLTNKIIKNYENYIRDIIRRDNDFIFNYILEENYNKWIHIKNYIYKNKIFKNYFYFTINYCIENDSNNCRNIICIFLKKHGLGKNLHKKNIVKYIPWKK